jgi:hypothetical protein
VRRRERRTGAALVVAFSCPSCMQHVRTKLQQSMTGETRGWAADPLSAVQESVSS